MPDRATVWGLPGALSMNVIWALSAPAPNGMNVISNVHEAPTATLWPLQVSELCVKLLLTAPVSAELKIPSGALPLFVIVRVWELRWPTNAARFSGLGLKDTAGAGVGPVVSTTEYVLVWETLSPLLSDAVTVKVWVPS